MVKELKAGRELDALVAEKVMGWEWIEYSSYDENRKILMPKNENGRKYVPCYSTDISAAWEVVEKLSEKFAQIHVLFCAEWTEGEKEQYFDRHSGSYGTGRCQVTIIGSGGGEVFYNADTAPLAICLAALKALGYE